MVESYAKSGAPTSNFRISCPIPHQIGQPGAWYCREVFQLDMPLFPSFFCISTFSGIVLVSVLHLSFNVPLPVTCSCGGRRPTGDLRQAKPKCAALSWNVFFVHDVEIVYQFFHVRRGYQAKRR